MFSGHYSTYTDLKLSDAVMLDFGSEFSSLKEQVKHYRNLSESADCIEAIHLVYDLLRWAETKQDCTHVLLPTQEAIRVNSKGHEHQEALFDRLYRAASGKSA